MSSHKFIVVEKQQLFADFRRFGFIFLITLILLIVNNKKIMLNKTQKNLESRLYAVVRRLILSIQNCESQLLQSCQGPISSRN